MQNDQGADSTRKRTNSPKPISSTLPSLNLDSQEAKPSPSSKTSPPTSQLGQGETRPGPIGQAEVALLSDLGTVGREITKGKIPYEAAAREMDKKLLALLPQCVTSSLKTIEGFAKRPLVVGIDKDNLPTKETIQWALGVVEASLQPAGKEDTYRELFKLSVRTGGRGLSEDDLKARLDVYRRDLERYPQDILHVALDKIGKTKTFWPAMAEVLAEVDNLMVNRKHLREYLQNALASAEKREKLL